MKYPKRAQPPHIAAANGRRGKHAWASVPMVSLSRRSDDAGCGEDGEGESGVSRANEPAYPLTLEAAMQGPGDTVWQMHGMTLREHYAGLAMQGILASWPAHAVLKPNVTADDAIAFADALIAALEAK